MSPVINAKKITKRDLDILNILWDSSEPMTASQIVQKNSELTMNTVQAVLRKLLSEKLIEVAKIVYSGTVLSRSYQTSVSPGDFAISQLTGEFREYSSKITMVALVSALLDSEPSPDDAKEQVAQLQAMLKEYLKK